MKGRIVVDSSAIIAILRNEPERAAIQRTLDQSPDSVCSLVTFVRFGKGRHPARLNMGDCFSYALAKSLDAPLLYKGDDFGHTDITSALAAGARP
jgi:ribonuclease VapC